ncbi:hypothetical protein KY285_016697 [Solanum tuberosum]|nr:hypothetical protein KY285_016697 [Solanum tuberosum]
MQLSNRDHSSDHSFEGRKVKKYLAIISAEQSYQSALFNQSTKTDGMKERKSCSAARPEEDKTRHYRFVNPWAWPKTYPAY